MENRIGGLPEGLQSATEALIENLLASEPFIRYYRAQTRLNADREAMRLLNQIATGQADLRKEQVNGTVTQEKIARLRGLQDEVQRNLTIREYAQAQQAAVMVLREVNQEISQLLGLDFASFTRQPTC